MSVAADPNAAVNDLADRFWEGVLERDPIWATILGDERYNDRWPDLGAGRARRRGGCSPRDPRRGAGDPGWRPRARAGHHARPAHPDLREPPRGAGPEAVPARHRPHVGPAGLARRDRAVPAGRHARSASRQLLARWTAYPAMVEQYISTLAEGVADGRTAAAVPVRRAIEQIDRLLAMARRRPPGRIDGAASPTMTGHASWPPSRSTSTAGCAACATTSRTSTSRMLGQSRASATPGGDAAYRLAIRMQTTIDTTAEEVHAFGLADLEAIEAEKDEIARRLGHADRHALRAALAEDPANHTDDPEALVRLAQEQTDRAYAAAPQLLRSPPERELLRQGGRAYREAESPPAFYMPPSLDGSRQGQYYINTYQPEERQLHKIAAITFHEATPGHHFQIAHRDGAEGAARLPHPRRADGGRGLRRGLGPLHRAPRRRDGPVRRRTRSGSACSTRSPSARRAWSSTRASTRWAGPASRRSTFMHERGSLPMVDAEIEVDRYTVWPGQALATRSASARSSEPEPRCRRADGRPVRPARLPRRGARPRLAAARHAAPRDPRLGRGGRQRSLIREGRVQARASDLLRVLVRMAGVDLEPAVDRVRTRLGMARRGVPIRPGVSDSSNDRLAARTACATATASAIGRS